MPKNKNLKFSFYNIWEFVTKRKAFLVALVLSSLFWFTNKLSNSVELNISNPLEYEIPDSLILNTSLPFELISQIKVTGWQILFFGKQLDNKTIKVKLDPKNKEILSQDLADIFTKNHPRFKFNLIATSPSFIKYDFDKAYSKTIPAIARIKDFKMNAGQIIKTKGRFVPDELKIFGSKAIIDEIDTFTHILDFGIFSGKKDSIIEIDFGIKRDLLKFEPKTLKFQIETEQSTEKQIKYTLVLSDSIQNNFKLIPESIDIVFKVGLSQYDQIKAEDFKIGLIDSELEGQDEGQLEYFLSVLNAPQKISSIRLKPDKVQLYKIKKSQ